MSCIRSKLCYLPEIISFVGEQVPLETDGKIIALTQNSFGCGYDLVVPTIETIKGWNKCASVVWKQQMMLGVVPKDTHRANNAKTLAHDLLRFYHKESALC